jgi:hypothetical protein
MMWNVCVLNLFNELSETFITQFKKALRYENVAHFLEF